MERNLVLPEQEPSYHDFNSTSTSLLRCSIDSKGTQTEFEWTDYSTAVFRFTCDKSSDGAESEHSHADQSFPSDSDSTSSFVMQKLVFCCRTEGILGVRMPARAVGSRKKESNLAPTHATGKNQLNNVFLFFGVIDILQQYSMLKHMEHVIKSLHADSPSVTGLNPRAYSNHFQEYLSKLFPENFDVSDGNML
ncbi:hypothetical protein BHE74_00046325 [Ensete ventricosum]|nr:hypothetical protein BHE74_00046325 [Ensete ventricosum]